MKKFLYKHRVLFAFLSVPYLCILILALVNINYDLTTPAEIDSIEDVISINEESKLDGSINVVSVYSYERINLLSYLIGKCNPYVEISESSPYANVSYDVLYQGGVIQKRVSLYNSLIAGYKEAGYELKSKYCGYIVHYLTTFADSNLEIGDVITEINHKELSNTFTPEMALRGIDKPEVEMTIIKNFQKSDEKTITVTIKGIELKTEAEETVYSFGLSVYAYNIPMNTEGTPNFTIHWQDVNSIGPSGGLLQSFYVYEKLTGAKLSKGLKIAGTGTVDVEGNAGLIGGIGQKIITAELSGVDIFFIPVTSSNYVDNPKETNYLEAIETYKKLKNPHMKIAVVWSLASIIDYLEDYHAGGGQ